MARSSWLEFAASASRKLIRVETNCDAAIAGKTRAQAGLDSHVERAVVNQADGASDPDLDEARPGVLRNGATFQFAEPGLKVLRGGCFRLVRGDKEAVPAGGARFRLQLDVGEFMGQQVRAHRLRQPSSERQKVMVASMLPRGTFHHGEWSARFSSSGREHNPREGAVRRAGTTGTAACPPPSIRRPPNSRGRTRRVAERRGTKAATGQR